MLDVCDTLANVTCERGLKEFFLDAGHRRDAGAEEGQRTPSTVRPKEDIRDDTVLVVEWRFRQKPLSRSVVSYDRATCLLFTDRRI